MPPKAIPLASVAALLFTLLPLSSAQSYIDYSSDGLPGKLYVPPEAADSERGQPLILALHGGGGIGSDNNKHIYDFSDLLKEAAQRGAFLYAPQAISAHWAINEERPAKIMAMIDRVIEERNADPQRIYVTGFSMGGGGTWDMLNLYPKRFAAGVPIASISPRTGPKLSNISRQPVWAFHARFDPGVPYTTTRTTVQTILADSQQEAFPYTDASQTKDLFFENEAIALRHTEWHEGGHDIWWRVYKDQDTIDWLFSQISAPLEVDLSINSSSTSKLSLTLLANRRDTIKIEYSSTLKNWQSLTQLEYFNKPIYYSLEFDASKPSYFYRVVESNNSR